MKLQVHPSYNFITRFLRWLLGIRSETGWISMNDSSQFVEGDQITIISSKRRRKFKVIGAKDD